MGDRSLKVWDAQDNKSVAAKLLFPFNAHRGTVGQSVVTLRDWYENDDDGSKYIATMVFFWPLKAFFLIPGNLMFSVPSWIRGALQGRAVRSKNLLPQADDDLPALYGKVHAIDEEVRGLLDKRDAVMGEIQERKLQLASVCEAEEATLDAPEVPPRLTE
jgi:hypothetical protein